MRLGIAGLLLLCISISPRSSQTQTLDQLRVEAPLKSVEELIIDLYSDNIPWNAEVALRELRSRSSLAETIALLQGTLNSPDYQQRQMVASLLRNSVGYIPDERLAEVIVEGLQDDILPKDPSIPSHNYVSNATGGTYYLLKYPEIGTGPLEDALDSADVQQQFLAAYILAVTKRHDETHRITEVLIPHLEDDRVGQNAGYATRALYEMGEKVVPYLQPYTYSSDEQQSRMTRFIIQEIEAAKLGEAGVSERRVEQCVTDVVANPATQLRFGGFDGFVERSYDLYE